MAFRARVRVRIAKSFTTDETELEFLTGGRPVRVTGGERGQKLSEAKWLELTARPFETEAAALSFGNLLRLRLGVASFACRLGLDGGRDQSTTWVNEQWARSIGLIKQDERCHPNIHGVMAVPDDELNRFPVSNAQGVVTTDPVAFFDAVSEVDVGEGEASASLTAVRLMNQAFMTSEPLAQLVLAFSAVEELGQDETWTDRQREILNEVAKIVEGGGDDAEARKEIGNALRSLHRLSLRQGVIRVLTRLGLIHLKVEWDRLYGIRSGIFHGTARLSDDQIHGYTNDALTLCGKVVLAQLSSEGIKPPAIAATNYPSRN